MISFRRWVAFGLVAALLASACDESGVAVGGDAAQQEVTTTVESNAVRPDVVSSSVDANTMTVAGPVAGFEQHWSWETPGELPQTVLADTADRPYLYVAQKGGGVAVLSSDANGELVTRVSRDGLGDHDAMNLAQQGDLLVVALGDFFGPGARAGVATIDVSDPRSPTVMGLWQSETTLGGAPDVLIDGETVFLTMMRFGVAAVDISDPATPRLLSQFRPDPNFPSPNPGSVAEPNARGLVVEGDLLYLANDAGGLRVLDVSNPSAMTELARYINPRTTKQQAYNDVLLDGDHLYISLDYCGFEVVDVSNPDAITQVAWLDPWDCNGLSNIWFNSEGHANELMLDRDRHTIWISAGGAELLAVNVSDPSNPAIVATLGNRENGRGTYGLGADADAIFLAYITTIVPFSGTWSGVTAVVPIHAAG